MLVSFRLPQLIQRTAWGMGRDRPARQVPLQTLFGFERVHVKAGQSVDVFLYPTLDSFMQVRGPGNSFGWLLSF